MHAVTFSSSSSSSSQSENEQIITLTKALQIFFHRLLNYFDELVPRLLFPYIDCLYHFAFFCPNNFMQKVIIFACLFSRFYSNIICN